MKAHLIATTVMLFILGMIYGSAHYPAIVTVVLSCISITAGYILIYSVFKD